VKALKVALITRPGSIPGERNVGAWAYAVPEFTWRHYEVPKGHHLNRVRFTGFDLIVWEDGKSSITWEGKGPPIAYVVADSTLSEEHYQQRLRLGTQADIILVDWDRLERFEQLGKPVRRFSYAVNDRRFKDWGEAKTIDVAYHLHENTPERKELGDWLAGFCQERSYAFARGTRLGDEYARAFSRARVTVDLPRNPFNRDHRLFDAMGCRTWVLTRPVPDVSGEQRVVGYDYQEWDSLEVLATRLDKVLSLDPDWERGLRDSWDAALECVQTYHTWKVRARELRATLAELGIG
jgi:hypothetical protein